MYNYNNFIVKFPSKSEVYVYALINGELTACKVLNVMVDVESKSVNVACESPDGVMNSFSTSDLYSGVESYKEGKTVKTVQCSLDNILPGCTEKNEDGTFCKFYWAMVDGEPKKVYIKAKRIIFNSAHEATNIELPDEFYSTREECIKWNDINIVEADGTKRVQKSVHRSLIITDEQRAIIDELKAVFEKAKDAGIVIGYNSDWMEWIAVNKTDHPYLMFEWLDNVSERDYNDAVRISERSVHDRFRVDLPAPAYISECERCIVADPAE